MIDRVRAIIDRFGKYKKGDGSVEFRVGSRSVEVESKPLLNVVLLLAIVVVGTSVAGISLVGIGSQPALAAADVTASDVNISTASGNVTGVTIAPNVTFTWNNVDEPVDRVSYRVFVGPSESNLEPTQPTSILVGGNRSGSLSYVDGTPADITDDDDFFGPIDDDPAPFDTSDFNASEGETTTTTVYIKIEARVENSDLEIIRRSNSTLTSFDVSVTNTEGSVSVNGQFDTNVTTPS